MSSICHFFCDSHNINVNQIHSKGKITYIYFPDVTGNVSINCIINQINDERRENKSFYEYMWGSQFPEYELNADYRGELEIAMEDNIIVDDYKILNELVIDKKYTLYVVKYADLLCD